MRISLYKLPSWVIYICLWLGCVPCRVSGQELIFTNISNRLELPSYECYNVVQDEKGYIWISTDNGLCRYNGKAAIVYNNKNGLPDNAIYFLKGDIDGGLKLVSSSSTVIRWNGNKFVPEKYSQKLKAVIKRDGERAYLLHETTAGDVINTYSGTYLADKETGELSLLSDPQSEYALKVVCDGKNSYFVRNSNFSYPYLVNGKYILKLLLVSGNKKKELKVAFNRKVEIDRRIKLKHINGIVFISVDDKLVAVHTNLSAKVYDFPSKILNLYGDTKNGLWVGLFQKGLYYYKNINSMESAIHSLREYSVSGTLVDREGGVWCSTLDKNIFYAPTTHSVSYSDIPKLNKLATMLKTVDRTVFISTAYDNLFEITDDKIQRLYPKNEHNQDYTDISFFNNKWYLSNKSATKITNTQFKGKFVEGKNYHFAASTFDIFNGRLFAADYTELFEIKNDIAMRLTSINAKRIRAVASLGNNLFYIGDNSGLGKVDISTGKRENIKGISAQVNKIYRASNNALWVATKGDGLNLLVKDGKLRRIRFKNKHDIFFDIVEDASGIIWASTENGLVSISLTDGIESTKEYDTSNGLLSNDIGYLAINGNKLFVSTIEGLCAIDLREIVNDTSPKIYLSSMMANKIPQRVMGNHWEFAHDQNSITLGFDVLAFKNQKHDILKYKFKEGAAALTGTADNELHFNNLSPDTYDLEVYAVNNDGVKSAPINIVFTIQKPFWKEYWFVALCILLTTTFLYLSVKRIIASVRAKELEKTKTNTLIAQSQLSALQAQMNPHFIFNAISSIQNYILKNDEKAAYNYLAKFGKLIRMVLNNSRESTLSLAQELETLELYVQLEQLRFKDSFAFELVIDEAVDTFNTHLPTMFIQPYVENAIWHGLMNLENTRDGILKVEISVDGGLLTIVVEDNGIGRQRSESFKRDALHHSVGMQLTEQRLKTIYKLKEYEAIHINIIDLKDNADNAIGTKVILILPLNL